MANTDSHKSTSLGHLPNGRWTFDGAVTDVFGDMLRRSIPNYECMREVVYEVGARYVRPDTFLLDLGCSRGEALESFVKRFGGENQYVGVDISEPMLEAARDLFEKEVAGGLVEIRKMDIKHEFPQHHASLTLAILTLQFIPIEFRQKIVRKVHANTVAGGAFILVEKVLGETEEMHSMMTEWYEEKKKLNGYSQEEIARKKQSLEGVLVPLKSNWNLELLRNAGFRKIDCIWRCMNFAGWVAVK